MKWIAIMQKKLCARMSSMVIFAMIALALPKIWCELASIAARQ